MASISQRGLVRCGRGLFARIGAAACIGAAPNAVAQCPTIWSGLAQSGTVRGAALFDEDGDGPATASLFVGWQGTSMINGVQANRIGRWRGGAWTQVGTNVVGGGLGGGGAVSSMLVFDDDGPGPNSPALHVGGVGISSADGVPISGVAKWDGVSWSSVGASGATASVNVLVVHDEDGHGPGLPALFAGGTFSAIGGATASRVARWNGAAWSALGGGVGSAVNSMTVFDEDGAGPGAPALFVGTTGEVLRWSDGQWTALSGAPSGTITALLGHDVDGPGPMPASLYLANLIPSSTPAPCVHRWTGDAWEPAGPIAAGGPSGTANNGGQCLAEFDLDGGGPQQPRLLVGLKQAEADLFLTSSASLRWYDGAAWTALETWPHMVTVHSLTLVDDGINGELSLIVGGSAPAAGKPFALRGVQRMRVTESFAPDAPTNAMAAPGGSASFTIGSSLGAATFEWRQNGVALVDGGNISGATTATLTINPVSATDQGIYECAAATGCGAGVSPPAMLVVTPAPETCPVDTNGDMVIDFLDLNGVLSLYGLPCP